MLLKCWISCLDIVLTICGGAGLHIGTTLLNPAHKYGVWGHFLVTINASLLKLKWNVYGCNHHLMLLFLYMSHRRLKSTYLNLNVIEEASRYSTISLIKTWWCASVIFNMTINYVLFKQSVVWAKELSCGLQGPQNLTYNCWHINLSLSH